MPTDKQCSRCGNVIQTNIRCCVTGYAKDETGAIVCYACCALEDAAWMREKGRITLYLTLPEDYSLGGPRRGPRMGWRYASGITITNWSGSLRFVTDAVKVGHHNVACHRYDVWFKGPDGEEWHGVTYGDMTQICHCRRVKG